MKNIEDFFAKYAMASLHGKSDEIASCYASSFMVATKTQFSAFKNDDEFIKWLNQVFDFNKKAGLHKMEVINIESDPIGEYFLKASVTWGTTFLKNPAEEIKFDIHYILNLFEKEIKIVFYISEDDQEELMKEKGLL
ncbi:MAG TPA: hypothetical protein VFG10_03630 [Saprospiraceae bacterium]|nr:hypothetical protein [Saprospiraceae bacterium]